MKKLKKAEDQAIHDAKNTEMIAGITMLSAMLLALLLSNTTDWYFYISTPIKPFIKEWVMVLFFMLVGMEIRAEFHEGFLARKNQIMLPLIATVGGMVVPIFIYLLINIALPQNYIGFAIPCATDIAFAICIFNIIAKDIPRSVKVFFLSIAIFDDIGAILIIALFYPSDLHFGWLIFSAAPIFIMWNGYKKNNTSPLLYLISGIALIAMFHIGGVSTSVAGIIVGMLVPLYDDLGNDFGKFFAKKLLPIVQFLVLPIFAFTVSGVALSSFSMDELLSPIVIGIILGLVLGKQIGITLFSYFGLRFGCGELPYGSKFFHIYNISIFAGIGFTMSLFVGMTAFKDLETQGLVKIGVLASLVICCIIAGAARLYSNQKKF